MNGKQGAYMLAIGGAFLLVMLGTRMSTLSFGQVFSPHREEDATKIAQLTAQVGQLQSENQTLADEAKRLTAVEDSNKALQADVDVLKSRSNQVQIVEKPVYVTRNTSPTESTATRRKPRSTPVSQALDEPTSGVVHRGDRPDVVRRVFGKPESVQEFGDEEWWLYDAVGLRKVVFKGGVVTEWRGMDVEP